MSESALTPSERERLAYLNKHLDQWEERQALLAKAQHDAPDESRDSADQLRFDRALGRITEDDFYRRWNAMEARERRSRAPADRATANRQEG